MRIGHLLDGPFLKGKNYEILYSSFTSRALNLDSELTILCINNIGNGCSIYKFSRGTRVIVMGKEEMRNGKKRTNDAWANFSSLLFSCVGSTVSFAMKRAFL